MHPDSGGSLTLHLAVCLSLLTVLFVSCRQLPEPSRPTTMELGDGWSISASADVSTPGSQVSSPDFDASGWTATSVPTTILAALVGSGAIEDPYFGRNLERIPVEPYQGPWWYRRELFLESPLPSQIRLVFEGINYSAEVWLNGQQVGSREELVGAFRIFEIDVSGHVVAGQNVLAVQVYPPQPGDFTIGFVDWNPTPPDRNMGIWRPVKLRLTGDVALDYPFVQGDVDTETLDSASLTIKAKVTTFSDESVTATVAGTIDDVLEVQHQVALQPGEERQIVLSPAEFPQLALDQPRLWWPSNLGEPNLYTLRLKVVVDGEVSDAHEVTFGIRDVEDYLNEQGHRGYRINGKEVLIRGGGWVDDMLLADDERRIEDQLRYVKHMNLNTIRLEGFWGSSQRLFDLADRYGILIMTGWSCQWEWEEYLGGPVDEYGGINTPAEMDLVARSLRDQVVWLRNHPSVFLWVLGSDMLPRPELERSYLAQLSEVDPTRPALAACAVATSEVSGPTGVKMNGPYDYVTPNYWYLDRERGGAFGFNTETGPGPQPPPIESIQRMLPEENWWPIDEMWEYHCGRNEFNTLDRYFEALNRRYGEAQDLRDFARKAQAANYEAMRGMFEAFSVRRPVTTGIIQWMLNSAWPEMYWQLYDHYLVPNGAFYGARNASRPVNIAYDYGTREIVLANDTSSPLAAVTAEVRILDARSEILFEQSETLDVAAGAIEKVFPVPAISTEQKVYFIDARIVGSDDVVLVSNFYWLSTDEDVLDWQGSEWFYTPIGQFADLTALNRLPEATIEVEHRFEPTADGHAVDVVLNNPSEHLALFIELKVTGSESGRLAAPVFWDDNYISLTPGERREIRATFPSHALAGEEPVFHYEGWNVKGN